MLCLSICHYFICTCFTIGSTVCGVFHGTMCIAWDHLSVKYRNIGYSRECMHTCMVRHCVYMYIVRDYSSVKYMIVWPGSARGQGGGKRRPLCVRGVSRRRPVSVRGRGGCMTQPVSVWGRVGGRRQPRCVRGQGGCRNGRDLSRMRPVCVRRQGAHRGESGCVRDWMRYRNGRDLSRRRPMGVSYGQSIHIQCNGLLPLPFWHGTVFNVIEDQNTIQKAK